MADPKSTSYQLPDKMTIVNAEHVYNELEALLTEEQLHSIDGSAVTQIDTAGLQILASLKRTMQGEGTTLTWGAVSEPLKAAGSMSGLSQVLGLDG